MTQPGSERRFVLVAALLLAVAAAPRLWAALFDHSVFWCDEIHQSLEPAHRAVFGYGFRAWEFRAGARSWLFPGLFVVAWKLAALVGVASATTLVAIAKLMMVACSLLAIALAIVWGRALGGMPGAVLAGVLTAAFPLNVVLGHRALTEVPSATLLLGATFLISERRARASAATAGALAGVALFLRYQNGVVAAGLLLWLLVSRRRAEALAFAAVAGAVVLLGGALDWLTWGHWFQSARAYLGFHARGGSAAWGYAAWSYYLLYLWRATGLALVPIMVGLVLAVRRAPAPVALVLASLAVHSVVGHKELRYVLPVVPLATTLAGGALGAALARPRGGAALAYGLAAVLAIALGWQSATDTYVAMGGFGAGSPWQIQANVNRLLLTAGKRADLCGLTLHDVDPWYTGGYTYLHRNVPFMRRLRPQELAAANYVLVRSTTRLPAEYAPDAVDSGWTLFRRAGACAPPPAGWSPDD
jgi:hypothetical protein